MGILGRAHAEYDVVCCVSERCVDVGDLYRNVNVTEPSRRAQWEPARHPVHNRPESFVLEEQWYKPYSRVISTHQSLFLKAPWQRQLRLSPTVSAGVYCGSKASSGSEAEHIRVRLEHGVLHTEFTLGTSHWVHPGYVTRGGPREKSMRLCGDRDDAELTGLHSTNWRAQRRWGGSARPSYRDVRCLHCQISGTDHQTYVP